MYMYEPYDATSLSTVYSVLSLMKIIDHSYFIASTIDDAS